MSGKQKYTYYSNLATGNVDWCICPQRPSHHEGHCPSKAMSTAMPCKGVTKLILFGWMTSCYWSDTQRAKGTHPVTQLHASLAPVLSFQITKAVRIALGELSVPHHTSKSTRLPTMCSADIAKDHLAKRLPALRVLLKIWKLYTCDHSFQPNKYFQRMK